MPTEQFSEFRRLVLDDTALQARLLAVENQREFVDLVVRVAAERRFTLTAEELTAEMRAGHRAWLERWV